MRDEPIIAAATLTMEMLVRQAPWEVKPKKDDERPEAHDIAKRVNDALGDMEHTWSEFVSEALNTIAFGVMPFEPVYKICRGDRYADNPKLSKMFSSKFDDGFIGWRKIAPRSPDSLSPVPWEFADGTNDVVAMRQQPAPDYKERRIPIEKLLLFRLRSCKDSPEGKAIYRSIYLPFFYLRRLREYEAIGAEKDMAGTPDFQVPLECFSPGASPEQQAVFNHFKSLGPRLRRGEYESLIRPAALDAQGKPTGYDFGLIQSGGRRPIDLRAIIEGYQNLILMVLQSEYKTLGQNGVGSHAMHSDKTTMLGLVIGAILDALCDLFNRTEIPRLCRFNGIPRDLFPELTHGDVEKVNLTEAAAAFESLVRSGAVVPTDKDDAHFRELGDLPPREEEDGAPVRPIDGINMDSPIDPSSIGAGYVPSADIPKEMLASEVPTQ